MLIIKNYRFLQQDIDQVFINKIYTSDELPAHLVELSENSSMNLNEEDKSQFRTNSKSNIRMVFLKILKLLV